MDRLVTIIAWVVYPLGIALSVLAMKDMWVEKRPLGILGSSVGLLFFGVGLFSLIHTPISALFSWLAVILIITVTIILFPYNLWQSAASFPIPRNRIDERDTMFARAARKPNTDAYDHYYALRPENQSTDDHLRSLAGLLSPQSTFYNQTIMKEADDFFNQIKHIEVDPKRVDELAARLRRSTQPEKCIKAICRELGAVAVGITILPPEFIYTYKGRHDSCYGEKITLKHPFAVVFLVEMDYSAMQLAPYAETVRESARQYYRAAVIAKYLSAVFIKTGYEANPQYDANYDVILPPLAAMAGLGEIGRNNILVADKFGSRVRIGAVTTTMPFKTDSYQSYGVDAFCEICKKCAQSCPSKSLDLADKSEINGVLKWGTQVTQCYAYWRRVGTDCGICMANCPFSKPNTFLHNLIRKAIVYSPVARNLALTMDDIIYGRKWKNT